MSGRVSFKPSRNDGFGEEEVEWEGKGFVEAIPSQNGTPCCFCGRPLNKIAPGVWNCGAGGPNYKLDESKGDIIKDKFGKYWIRKQNHK
jgi:hypothetical protein